MVSIAVIYYVAVSLKFVKKLLIFFSSITRHVATWSHFKHVDVKFCHKYMYSLFSIKLPDPLSQGNFLLLHFTSVICNI